MKPEEAMKNPDGMRCYCCPVCGRLWWEKSLVPKICDCGTDIDSPEDEELIYIMGIDLANGPDMTGGI